MAVAAEAARIVTAMMRPMKPLPSLLLPSLLLKPKRNRAAVAVAAEAALTVTAMMRPMKPLPSLLLKAKKNLAAVTAVTAVAVVLTVTTIVRQKVSQKHE